MDRDAKIERINESSGFSNENCVPKDHLFNTHQIEDGLVNPIVDYLDVFDPISTYGIDTRRLKRQGLKTKDIERPKYILFNKTKGFTVNGEVHRPAKDKGAFAVLTEHRLFVLVGGEHRDLYWSIEYDPSISMHFNFGTFKHRIDIIDHGPEDDLLHIFYINRSIERKVLNFAKEDLNQQSEFCSPVVKRVHDSMRRSPPTALNTAHMTLSSLIQPILHETEKPQYTVSGLEIRISRNPENEWPTLSELKPSTATYITFTDSRIITIEQESHSEIVINYDSLRQFRFCATFPRTVDPWTKWKVALQTDNILLDFLPANVSLENDRSKDIDGLSAFMQSMMGLEENEIRSTYANEISDDVFQYDRYFWGPVHPMHSESTNELNSQYDLADFSTFSNVELLNLLCEIDPTDFEHFIADLWQRREWKTKVTSASSDNGIDIVAEREAPFHEKQLIQAKKYDPENKVGGPEVQQYSSLRHQRAGVDAVIIVTTSSFSSQARDLAADLNVKLVDGNQLCDLIERVDGYDLYSDIILTQ
jgi:hypothetical protein